MQHSRHKIALTALSLTYNTFLTDASYTRDHPLTSKYIHRWLRFSVSKKTPTTLQHTFLLGVKRYRDLLLILLIFIPTISFFHLTIFHHVVLDTGKNSHLCIISKLSLAAHLLWKLRSPVPLIQHPHKVCLLADTDPLPPLISLFCFCRG